MNKESPEEKKRAYETKWIKSNPTGSLRDGLNRAETGSPVDIAGGMNWKGTGIIILVLLLGYIVYTYFFSWRMLVKILICLVS